MPPTYAEISLGRRVRSFHARGVRFIEASYPPESRFRPHAHDHTNITVLLRGCIEETVARQTIQSQSLSVVVKPAGTVHANRFGIDEVRTFVIELSEEIASATENSATRDWRWFHGGEVAAAATRIYHLFRSRLEANELEMGTIDLLASISRHIELSKREHLPEWIGRVREFLQDQSPARVSVEQLARESGVHPVYLARVFRDRYGCTISQYIHALRVRRAAHQIVSSTTPLSQIAADNGFADQPHLSRIFKRWTSFSPAEFRNWVACKGLNRSRLAATYALP